MGYSSSCTLWLCHYPKENEVYSLLYVARYILWINPVIGKVLEICTWRTKIFNLWVIPHPSYFDKVNILVVAFICLHFGTSTRNKIGFIMIHEWYRCNFLIIFGSLFPFTPAILLYNPFCPLNLLHTKIQTQFFSYLLIWHFPLKNIYLKTLIYVYYILYYVICNQ